MKRSTIFFVFLTIASFFFVSCNNGANSSETSNPTASVQTTDVKSYVRNLISEAEKLEGTEREKIKELSRQWGKLAENATSAEKKDLSSFINSLTDEEHAYLAILSAIYHFDTNGMSSDLEECLSDFKRLQDAR